MPSIQATVGQPPSTHSISFSPLVIGAVRAFGESHSVESSARMIAEYSHAPPGSCSPAFLPLRI